MSLIEFDPVFLSRDIQIKFVLDLHRFNLKSVLNVVVWDILVLFKIGPTKNNFCSFRDSYHGRDLDVFERFP